MMRNPLSFQDGVHLSPAGGARKSLPRGALSRCVCPGDVGHEDGTAGRPDTGTITTCNSHLIDTQRIDFNLNNSRSILRCQILLLLVVYR